MAAAATEPKAEIMWANNDFGWTETLEFCLVKLRSATALLKTKSMHLVFHTRSLSPSMPLTPSLLLYPSLSYFKGKMIRGGAKVSMSTWDTGGLCTWQVCWEISRRGRSRTCMALLDTGAQVTILPDPQGNWLLDSA